MSLPSAVRRPPRAVRRVVLALAVVVLAAVPPGAGRAPAHAQGTSAEPWLAPPVYEWPVAGQPVRTFAAPAGPYGAGHRGVDLAVDAGRPVQPMADGTITFAGTVAGERWVTVAHRDGVLTSYGPLARVGAPRLGQVVDRGDVIGRAAGQAHGTAGRLHVGARRAGRYLDPATLVAASPPMVATLVGPGKVTADAPTRPQQHLALVPGTAPSPNHLVVLPGLTSSTGDNPFDLAALGYGVDDWQQYSYLGVDEDGDPLAYGPQATWGRVHDMALALRDQLRAHAAANPGQAVDLLGHSLGGMVGMYYLLVLHDATDPTLPPIGRVVTVASPLEGADSANVIAMGRESSVGRLLIGLLEQRMTADGQDEPPAHADMPVIDDLQTDSEVVAAVAEAWDRYRDDPWSSPLATGTDVLTLGSSLDMVVNEHRSDLPGAAHETVGDIDMEDAHSNITRDDRTQELLAAHLAGEPLPDGGWRQDVVDWTSGAASTTVAAAEYALGVLALEADRYLPLP